MRIFWTIVGYVDLNVMEGSQDISHKEMFDLVNELPIELLIDKSVLLGRIASGEKPYFETPDGDVHLPEPIDFTPTLGEEGEA